MNYFHTVNYHPNLEDNSWHSLAENAANVCMAPGRWLAAELWSGGKKYMITKSDQDGQLKCQTVNEEVSHGIRKVMRFILGTFLFIPGSVISIPLKSFAFSNEEIRLKHKMVIQPLSQEDKQRLDDLIKERQRLAKERQGCPETISCFLLSIVCLLCCLVCKK